MSRTSTASGPFMSLLVRLHFYIGLFVGPFLLVAAASGVVYALSPQLEPMLYRHALYTESQGKSLPLSKQVEAAEHYLQHDGTLFAIRPAPQPGMTTRVQFAEAGLRPSESRAVFIDPVTGEVRGDHVVYGTSGVLPVRGLIDQFHRGLLLGDVGRLYSELAASWLWVGALGGMAIWWVRRRQGRQSLRPMRRWHARVGLCLMLGLLFFSATGLTWSQYAGDRIGVLRQHYGWATPAVVTSLKGDAPVPADHADHADHMGHHMADPPAAASVASVDSILATARAAGIGADLIEVRPPRTAGQAWTVSEIDRRWPTRVDAVSVDPRHLTVLDHVRFADYPLAAKLTRWGIDLHMGVLFGFANQLILSVFALGLVAMTVWGYLMWWRRRPSMSTYRGPLRTFMALTPVTRLCVGVVAVALGYALPVLGASLVLFLLVDALLSMRLRKEAVHAG
ncbi:PepSY-associated TM helix domain-containing protein [Pseudomonas sp. Marseille-QA0892]